MKEIAITAILMGAFVGGFAGAAAFTAQKARCLNDGGAFVRAQLWYTCVKSR